MKLGITMPCLNQPLSEYPLMARAAEDAGLDSAWFCEFYRNPFVVLGACAGQTSRIGLGTALAAGVGRTPFEMANAAVDVDELSGGRVLLGAGTGGPQWVEYFHGNDGIDRPVPRMREYVHVMREVWRHQATGEPISFEGEFYRVANPPLNPWGGRPMARPTIPVYLAGLRPLGLRLAGEIADGLMAYFISPGYYTEVVAPNIAEGAAKAGRDPADVDIVSLTLCSASDDRDEAMRLARISVGMYACYPVSDPMVSYLGLTEDRDAVLKAMLTEGLGALERTTSDALVRAFCIAGTPDECAEQLAAYTDVMSHVVLHTPYVPPITAAESHGAFHRNLAALGPAFQAATARTAAES
jgi:probable F420-dependent oxidoreductase